MLIDRLFAPKWKHKNPQVRKRALLALEPQRPQTQEIFAEVVRSDPELFIRRLAIQRLTDIDRITALYQAMQNHEIHEAARYRLCELLSTVNQQRNFGQIRSRLEQLDELRIYEYVAKHTQDEALQKFALEKISNEMVLVDVLVSTDYGDIRSFILTKLDSTNALKRAVKSLKRKDKRIAALAQEKLDKLDEQRSRSREILSQYKRVGRDFMDLFNLCKLSGEWAKYEMRLRQLHEQWHGLSVSLDDVTRSQHASLAQQVEQAFTTFERELHTAAQKSSWEVVPESTHTDAIENLQSLRDQVGDRLAQCNNTDIDTLIEEYPALTEFITTVKQRWQTTYDKLIAEAGRALPTADLPQIKSAFTAAIAQLQDIATQLPALQKYRQELTEIIAEAQHLMASDAPVTAKAVDRLKQRYRQLSAPRSLPVDDAAVGQYQQAISALQDRLSRQEQERQATVEAFCALCPELQEAVQQGRTKHAIHLANRGKKLLKGLDEKGKTLLEKRGDSATFNTAVRQLQELQDWRHWSSASVKEQLIEDMQQLAQETETNAENPDFDFTGTADAVKAARQQWKKLAGGETAPDQELWQAFDDACNRAYQPCQARFEQLGEQRAANLQQREQVCYDLEVYLETVEQKLQQQGVEDADDVDWKAMEKIIRTARRDWGRLGMVNRSDRTAINKRFNKALHSLEKLLRNRQQSNLEAKEALIKRVEYIANQLADQAQTLEQAIEAVKKAQADWKTVGKAAREKTLWKQFREACDRVFAVREAEQQAEKQQHEQEKQQRQQIIEGIERAATVSDDSLLQARTDVDQLKAQWSELPGLKKTHGLERRFNDACRRFDRQLEQFFEEQLRNDKQKLQQNAGLCYQLETEIFQCMSGNSTADMLMDSVVSLEQQWQAVDSRLKSIDQAIRERFQHLSDYVNRVASDGIDRTRQELQANETALIDQKDNLCIQMEILANVESPPEARQRRMEYQVAQLANKMKESDGNNTKTEIENLLIQWHRSGFVNPHLSQDLEQRFYSALESLDKDYQYNNPVIV